MAKETKSGILARYGPMGAPIVAVVAGVAMLATVFATNKVPDHRDTLQAEAVRVETGLAGDSRTAETTQAFPVPRSVIAALTTIPEQRRVEYGPLADYLALPLGWRVQLQDIERDVFTEYAGDKNYWDRDDFDRAIGARVIPDGRFDDWDRNGDGRITRDEFNNPPGTTEEEFARLDRNGNGRLTAPNEVSESQLREMDFEQRGYATLEDYRRWRRGERARFFRLTAPDSVNVVVDLEGMGVHISWQASDGPNLPPDLAYVIQRRAPETVAAREAAWHEQLQLHAERERQWNARLEAWLDQPAKVRVIEIDGREERVAHPEGRPVTEEVGDNGETRQRTFREIIPHVERRTSYQRYKEYEGNPDNRPTTPERPQEWETIAGPLGETEYRDTSFMLDVTYMYAVVAVTRESLLRGVAADEKLVPGYKASPRTLQEGRPVLIRNRVEMSRRGAFGVEQGTVRLSQWLRVERSPGEVRWLRASVEETLNSADETPVGRLYQGEELARQVTLTTPDGESAATELEHVRSIDFQTGFRFIEVLRGPEFRLRHRELGDFVLPRASDQPPTVFTDNRDKTNPVEIRVLSMTDEGREAVIETMRWFTAADGLWYRVALRTRVRRGENVGATVRMASLPAGAIVWDSLGNRLDGMALREERFRGVEIDLSAAGAFGGLDGRVISIGEHRVDLFGTLYIE